MSAGSWNVTRTDGGQFGLKMKDTLNAYGGIPGNILLCGDQLFFDDNYPVGGREFYTRIP
jgi:hypothetical protein